MFFLYDTYNFFYYLIKLIVIQPQYICVYMIFFFFNAGIAYSITNDIEDQVCFSLFFAGYGILSKNPFETLPCLSASAFCLFLFDILRRSFMK